VWTYELRRHKGRTAVTAGAVAIAMALLVSMLSISDGIIQTVESQIEDSQADLLIAAPFDTNFAQGRAIAANITSWDEVDFASPTLQGLVSMESGKPGTGEVTPVAVGVRPGEFYAVLPERDRALFSHWFNEGGDPHFSENFTGPWTGEVIVSKELARKLEVSQNDSVTVARSAGVQGRTFRVVGIADPELSPDRVIQDVRVAFFHLSELQDITGEAVEASGSATAVVDRVSRLYVALTASARLAPDGAKTVQQRIEAAYPDFAGMVSTKQDRLARLQDEYVVGRLFYTAIGFVALTIGLLFVGCVVMISVSERTRDIGVLRAIGIARRSIFLMVLAEAIVLVSMGALAGVVPALFGAQALGDSIAAGQGVAPTFIQFSPQLVLTSLAQVIMFGALLSLYPAWRATRIPVVDALAARG
jgi:ABC-type antimicrobial peptide transport system permease subunit